MFGRGHRRRLQLAPGLLLAMLGAVTGAGRGTSPDNGVAAARSAGSPRLLTVPWSELELEAHKFLVGASTTVAVHLGGIAEVGPELRASPQDRATRSPVDTVAVVSLSSDLPFGRSERSTAWLDPVTGRALQAERLTSGRKPSWKLRRYLEDGEYSWRAEPTSKAEERLEPEHWSRRSERMVSWPQPPPADIPVSDSYALLYLVSAHPWDGESGELRLLLLAKDRLVEARFSAGEVVTGRFDFEQVEHGQTTRRNGELRARVVRGKSRELGSQAGEDDVDLGFLGLRGEITILLELGTGVPLEIRGRAQGVGAVKVRLQRVVMASGPGVR